MKTAKIINYVTVDEKVRQRVGSHNVAIGDVAMFQNGMFLECVHPALAPTALVVDRSVFAKTKGEKKQLDFLRSVHKTDPSYNPRPKEYITITQ